MKKIIYDLGANEGKCIPYYLLKSDLVIAVEANPQLCELLKKLYHKDILDNKLVVDNSVVTHDQSTYKNFYVSKFGSYFSTCVPERKKLYFRGREVTMLDYEEKNIKSINILELFEKYGKPYYVKIDLEHYDDIILNEILNNYKNKPQYLSSECQDIKVFNLMMNSEEYNLFKYIKGSSVSKKYNRTKIKDINDLEKEYSFAVHSAGPFGNDIEGPWFNKEEFIIFFSDLVAQKIAPGWIDIHCSLME
jgi:FkbM family methyltransferase